MTAAHTTALGLLGKQVSFTTKRIIELSDKSLITFEDEYSGIVTSIVLSLSGDPEISIDDGDFFSLPELIDFKLL
jgi:hypothetical protein